MHDESIGNFSAFRREWVVRGRRFDDGQVEVTVDRFDRYVGCQGLNLMPRAKRGESENGEQNLADAAKRAKQQVRLRCKAIGADRMITLTYHENMTDKARLKRDFDAFRRRLSKIQDFHYVAVAERQKRGAWHLHIAVKGRQNYRVLRSVWGRVIGCENVRVHVRNPFKEKGLRHKLASYIGKYITKEFGEHSLNEKRYWTSKGVAVPERQSIAHLVGDSPVDAIRTAYRAVEFVGGTFDRCQVFWNEALGCFWLSTREV
ncbi:rolling circle replication-associated protein [Paraburkholderia xenovorans]